MERQPEPEPNQSQDLNEERAAGFESPADASGDTDVTPVSGDPADLGQTDSAAEGFADGAE
jgi:hypothetical protein